MALAFTRFEFHPRDTGYVIQRDHFDDGSVVTTMVPVAGAPAAAANYAALLTKARNALNANQNYLAINNPTTAQAVTQVAALTRQVDALIYFLLHELVGLAATPGI